MVVIHARLCFVYPFLIYSLRNIVVDGSLFCCYCCCSACFSSALDCDSCSTPVSVKTSSFLIALSHDFRTNRDTNTPLERLGLVRRLLGNKAAMDPSSSHDIVTLYALADRSSSLVLLYLKVGLR